jgi:hypothetical protein
MTRLAIVFTAMFLSGGGWCQDSSGMASGMLQQKKMAQQAIQARDREAALDHIHQAVSLADGILQQTPTNIHPVMVPVAREIETTSTYTPVKHGKEGEMTASRIKKNTSIREVEGDVTIEEVDVTNASDRLRTADAALQKFDWTAAELALDSIGVVETHSRGDMPLLKARDNLMLARTALGGGKNGAIEAPLRSAAEALGDFAHTTSSGQDAASAEAMQKEILAYAHSTSEKHDDTAQRLNAWLERIEQWHRARTGLR